MIALEQIGKVYGSGRNAVAALRGVDLRIERGEAVAIVGPSGSGKTTLLDILGALSRPTSGTYQFEGLAVNRLGHCALARLRNRRLGFVFQSFNLQGDESVAWNLALPMRYGRIGFRERRRRMDAKLEAVGLRDKLRARARQLSGGEQQRVAIARALIMEPDLVLADEPTGNLDSANGQVVAELLLGVAAAGRTLVLITHDEALAARFPRIVRLQDGQVVADERASPRATFVEASP